MSQTTEIPEERILFTCLSCSIAFLSAEEQRIHYRSDHHRYNMKRRVASLPPVSAYVFDQKVMERRAETAVMATTKGSTCEICNKVYTTDGAYQSHIASKKHKENVLRTPMISKSAEGDSTAHPSAVDTSPIPEKTTIPSQPSMDTTVISLIVEQDASEEKVDETIDEKIAAARSRLSLSHCLFCPKECDSLEENLAHMSSSHSFFIPDVDYLIDIPGLISYLGEKIAVGNVCIFCNGKGREFRTLVAVRKHMQDKSHCKIAYDSLEERLEISDYYDFTSSYPDGKLKNYDQDQRLNVKSGEEWEDIEDNDEEATDEIVDEVTDGESSSNSSSDESLPDNLITYGESDLELVLPSGARIGHRTMRRYYAQSFPGAPRGGQTEDPNSGAALVRRLLADKNSTLVPRRGGFGAYGWGTEVVKARNRGEAREAGRHVREFRDNKRRDDFKTKVGFIHNSQKHFRDHLLQ